MLSAYNSTRYYKKTNTTKYLIYLFSILEYNFNKENKLAPNEFFIIITKC